MERQLRVHLSVLPSTIFCRPIELYHWGALRGIFGWDLARWSSISSLHLNDPRGHSNSTFVRRGRGGLPKTNNPYLTWNFSYIKSEQGGRGSKSWQIWANVLFGRPPWPPRDLASNNDIHVYLVAKFDDMPSGISKEWKTKLWHFQNCMVWNLK